MSAHLQGALFPAAGVAGCTTAFGKTIKRLTVGLPGRGSSEGKGLGDKASVGSRLWGAPCAGLYTGAG